MNKVLYISMLLVSAGLARENPFFSTSESSNLPISSNNVQHQPPLTSMTYNFPDQARILKEATFTFQNIDGTLETRKIEIDQSIDWHNPLIISQHKTQKENTLSSGEESYSGSEFIQFSHAGNRISLLTKLPILRSFSLTEPNRVVVDFSHKIAFKHYGKNLSDSPFLNVHVANHGKFARATITLDGKYTCSVSKTDQGASVFCK